MSITPLHRFALAAGVVATLALAGCVERETGPATTEERQVADFQSIELRGAAQMQVQVGPAASLKVTAAPRAQAAFTSTVQGNKLLLESHNRFWRPHGDVDVTVTVPLLQSLTVSGAGKINMTGISGETLTLSLNGAADLDAEGKVGTLFVSMNGAGETDLSRLEAGSATVSVNGAGSMDVNVTGTLDATVNGVGNVNYLGKPANVTTAINGVGSISPRSESAR